MREFSFKARGRTYVLPARMEFHQRFGDLADWAARGDADPIVFEILFGRELGAELRRLPKRRQSDILEFILDHWEVVK